MKSKKWLTYALGVVLTLIVLAMVGGIGFRMGVMQSASFAKLTDGQPAQAPFFIHSHGMDGDFNRMDRGNFPRGLDRGYGGSRGRFFPPIFGLIHLALFGALIYFGYKLIKNSGWKLIKVNTNESATPVAEQAPKVAGDEKKE